MAKQKLEKVTIRLMAGDKSKIDDYFPDTGHNVVIRTLVNNFLKSVDAKANQNMPNTEPQPDINLENLIGEPS